MKWYYKLGIGIGIAGLAALLSGRDTQKSESSDIQYEIVKERIKEPHFGWVTVETKRPIMPGEYTFCGKRYPRSEPEAFREDPGKTIASEQEGKLLEQRAMIIAKEMIRRAELKDKN